MKKLLFTALTALFAVSMTLSVGNASVQANAAEITTVGKAAYLCDFASGTQVYARKAEKHLPIASMCKIMTLLLSFEAVDNGALSYDEMITVSENASAMGGSQVYLDAGLSYCAGDLIKTVAVCSANDSCVALAERIAGSESDFVAKMNARAKELGAENTLFANCTGLPKEPQYSCAKDVATMLRALLTHEKYFEFSKVWYEDFPHPDGRTISITNTNKLIRRYTGCDGGKTGFTSEAGFCLAATAKRGDTRLISVIIGADSSENRFEGITAMFDYCFNCYETRVVLEAGKPLEEKVSVRCSQTKEISIVAETPLTAFAKRGETGDYQVTLELCKDLKAPLKQGDEVGNATLFHEGVEIGRTKLLAGEDALKLRWWDAFRETAQNWQ